jgi:hypothetical protein
MVLDWGEHLEGFVEVGSRATGRDGLLVGIRRVVVCIESLW